MVQVAQTEGRYSIYAACHTDINICLSLLFSDWFFGNFPQLSVKEPYNRL